VIDSKLGDVRQALDPMTIQGDIARFLSNAENAQELNDLVDDIREAVVDYQVRTSRGLTLRTSDVYTDLLTTGYLRKSLQVHCKF